MLRASVFLFLLLSVSASSWAELHPCSQVKHGDVVLFYPTESREVDRDGEKYLEIPIHAHVFQPRVASVRRRIFVRFISQVFGLTPNEMRGPIFENRSSLFTADNESGRNLTIRIADRYYRLRPTEGNGHSFTTLEIPAKDFDETSSQITFALKKANERACGATGTVFKVAPQGVTVVSDIDDTIKISNVRDRKELIRNTLVRPFMAIPGMSDWYKQFGSAVNFHYLSSSPWQLFSQLNSFLSQFSFPLGAFDLKFFRLWDRSLSNLLGLQKGYKLERLRDLIKRYPGRQYILIGDSGEQDPKIYGQIAREFPGKIKKIFIREVEPAGTGEDQEKRLERYLEAFEDVPSDKWQVFRNACDAFLNSP